MRPHTLGICFAVAAVLSGSGCAIPIRMLQHSNVFTQVLCRSAAMGTALLLLALALWGRKTPQRVRRVGWVVAAGCVFLATQDIAISAGFLMTKASNVVFIINTSPVFCAVMDRFVLKEAVPLRSLVMISLGLCGVLVILLGEILQNDTGDEEGGLDADSGMYNPVLGNFIVLLNPVSWALYWTVVRHAEKLRAAGIAEEKKCGATENASEAVNDPELWWEEMLAIQLITTAIEAVAGAVGMLLTGWAAEAATIVTPDDLWTYAWFGGLYVPCVILLFSLAPRYIATAEMGSIKMLETVTTPFWIWIYDKEIPSWTAVAGGALIVLAICGWSVATLKVGASRRVDLVEGKVAETEVVGSASEKQVAKEHPRP